MYIKSFIKSVLVFILVLTVGLSFNSLDAKAASTKTGWVSISSGTLNVRSAPSTNSKSVGSLKNNTQVTVYSQTKSGWSEIRYNKKKAYVSSQYLRMYSYLMDKTKVYTYYYPRVKEYQKLRYKSIDKGWQKWVDSAGYNFFNIKEDSKGLYSIYPGSTANIEISYPLKNGKLWDKNSDAGVMAEIVSTNGTLKTKAGTFKNVVTVYSDEGDQTYYYAPNVGLIKSVSEGETRFELISLTKKY